MEVQYSQHQEDEEAGFHSADGERDRHWRNSPDQGGRYASPRLPHSPTEEQEQHTGKRVAKGIK